MPTPAKPSAMLDFPAFLTKCLPALMQVMPHVALPSADRKGGFPTDLHEAAHRLYYGYKSMCESFEATGWNDDFGRMDYDLRVLVGDTIRDDLLLKYAPQEYEAREQAKRYADTEAVRAKATEDLASRREAWKRAGADVGAAK